MNRGSPPHSYRSRRARPAAAPRCGLSYLLGYGGVPDDGGWRWVVPSRRDGDRRRERGDWPGREQRVVEQARHGAALLGGGPPRPSFERAGPSAHAQAMASSGSWHWTAGTSVRRRRSTMFDRHRRAPPLAPNAMAMMMSSARGYRAASWKIGRQPLVDRDHAGVVSVWIRRHGRPELAGVPVQARRRRRGAGTDDGGLAPRRAPRVFAATPHRRCTDHEHRDRRRGR